MTLTVRGYQSDDWETLYDMWTRDEVLINTFDIPYTGEDAFRDRFNTPVDRRTILIAETSLPSGRKRVVGIGELAVDKVRRAHNGRVSITVDPEHGGPPAQSALLQAIVRLAVNWLGLHRLEAIVFAEDGAALALYESQDFAREATMRRYALRAGVQADAVLLARLLTGDAS